MLTSLLRHSFFVFFVYILLTLILTYPLIFNLTIVVPNDIGDPLLNTWILAWDSHALLTDPLNLFNANIFHPLANTLAYSEHLFSTALLSLPLQLISGEPILAYNLSLLLTFPLSAFGMYLLALRWTGRRDAAFLACLIFAFNPYRFAAIAHLQLLTFQWLPFALLFLDLLLRRTRQSQKTSLPSLPVPLLLCLALTLFLLLQILASWYLALYTALIFVLYLFAVLLARYFKPSPPATLPPLTLLLATLLLVTLLILPFILPYLAIVDELRAARPLSLALSLAAAPTDFAAAAPFNRIFGPLTETFRSRPGFTEEHVLFVGIIAPILALVALTYQGSRVRWQASRARFYALLFILIFSVALVFPTPYAVLATLSPPSTIVRVPSRWIIPALFALAALAAFGFANLKFQIANRKSLSLISNLLFPLCVLLLLTETLSIPLPLAPVENRDTLNPVYAWLAAQPDNNFALVELPLHSAPAPEYPEVKRLYASTLGWWRLVNGYSGYTPPRQPQLAQALANFPDEQSIKALRSLIHNSQFTIHNSQLFLLVHPGEAPLDRAQWETTDRWRAECNPALYPLGQFAGDYLYHVLPNDPHRFTPPPLATFGPNQTIRLLKITVDLPATPTQFMSKPLEIHNSQFTIHNSHSSSRLILYWQSAASPATDYTIFVHLRAADGFVRSQADGPPVSGHYPTSQWQPGEIVQDIHPLPPADYAQVDHIALGLYDAATGQRLPTFGPAGERLAEDELIVGVENNP
ncbi:MAG: hypothetical protein JW953_12485 [Anaerolineae bacterium]|nr:hypothetical protein [Anaerolineae bacterium]